MQSDFFSRLFQYIGFALLFFCGIFLLTQSSFAEKNNDIEWTTGSFRLKHEYQHFVIPDAKRFWYTEKQIISADASYDSENENTEFPESFCLAEDFTEEESSEQKKEQEKESNTNNTKTIFVKKIDRDEIRLYLEETVAPHINQEQTDVRIFRDEKGDIQFEGVGQRGKILNIEASTSLIEAAIRNGVSYVSLDVAITEPVVTVEDEELKKLGIKELVAVGRSNFKGSTGKRIINVMNGASKFNGHIVKKGETFSFTTTLGEIDGSTGYVKELVILGNKVLPEYGGGLCQVSSTSYRAAMLAGMEIVERHNHSYAVSYYEPHGSDATIYSGVKDFQFKNTSDAAILIQTRRGGWNNEELFFHYYGTKPERDVKIFGPLKLNYRSPPKTKITYDSSKPAGWSQTVSHRVTGFNSYFFRTVKENGEDLYTDRFASRYQARGTWVIRGGSKPSAKKEGE